MLSLLYLHPYGISNSVMFWQLSFNHRELQPVALCRMLHSILHFKVGLPNTELCFDLEQFLQFGQLVSSLLFFTEIIADLFWGDTSLETCCTVFRFGSSSSGPNIPQNCRQAVSLLDTLRGAARPVQAHFRPHRFCCCGAKSQRAVFSPEWLFSILWRLLDKITQICHLSPCWGASTLPSWRGGDGGFGAVGRRWAQRELGVESYDEIGQGCKDSWKR